MERPDSDSSFAQMHAGGAIGLPKADNNQIEDYIYSRFTDAREGRVLTFSESPLGNPGLKLAGTIYHGSVGALILAHGRLYYHSTSRRYVENLFAEINQTGVFQEGQQEVIEAFQRIIDHSHDGSKYDGDVNGHDIVPNLQTMGKFAVATYETSMKGHKKLYNKRSEVEDRALLKKDALVLLCMLELGTMLLFASPEVYQRYVHDLEDMDKEGRQEEWLQMQEERFHEIGILPR